MAVGSGVTRRRADEARAAEERRTARALVAADLGSLLARARLAYTESELLPLCRAVRRLRRAVTLDAAQARAEREG